MSPLYIPMKRQKNFAFLVFSGGIKVGALARNTLWKYTYKHKLNLFTCTPESQKLFRAESV